MKRTGEAKLWLVNGPVPHFNEMVTLSREIARWIIHEYGPDVFVNRLADTHWLSCLACVLGFEWNTSGQTTVTLLALKKALIDSNLGVVILGGKGSYMKSVIEEINQLKMNAIIDDEQTYMLKKASRLTCRVDNNALQDSYNVYFHSIILSSLNKYAVINQGMNIMDRTARRYHWISDNLSVEEPHVSIRSDKTTNIVLDLVSPDSQECRKTCIDIVHDQTPNQLQRELEIVKKSIEGQTILGKLDIEEDKRSRGLPFYLMPPRKFNQDLLLRLKDEINSFEELLLAEDVGPATIRGLAFIASLVHGAQASWKDPVKYTYAHGTKSGWPYMVDKRAMRREAELIREAIESSRIGDAKKLQALARLTKYIEMLNY